MTLAERRARAVLDRLPDGPVRGAEVGVYRGEMSAALLRRPDLFLEMVDDWLPASVRSVTYRQTRDPRATDDAAVQRANRAEAERATAFAADRRRIIAASSPGAADHVHDASLDFVFIDAEHSYEAVTADIAAWRPKVAPGGLLCGHDYTPPGEYGTSGWPGVVRAVDEAVERNGWTLDLGDRMTWFVRLP